MFGQRELCTATIVLIRNSIKLARYALFEQLGHSTRSATESHAIIEDVIKLWVLLSIQRLSLGQHILYYSRPKLSLHALIGNNIEDRLPR
jgi:hypothetical protein